MTGVSAEEFAALLRRCITQELEMWDQREPAPMTYAQGVRDGLQAALTYMDSIEGKS